MLLGHTDLTTVGLQNRRDKKFRLAVGSFIEDLDNRVEIITRKLRICSAVPCIWHSAALVLDFLLPLQVDDETGKFSSDSQLQFQHPYPPTKIMFIPDKECNCPDLVATTGDYLRIWQLTEEGTTLQKLLNNVICFCIQWYSASDSAFAFVLLDLTAGTTISLLAIPSLSLRLNRHLTSLAASIALSCHTCLNTMACNHQCLYLSRLMVFELLSSCRLCVCHKISLKSTEVMHIYPGSHEGLGLPA